MIDQLWDKLQAAKQAKLKKRIAELEAEKDDMQRFYVQKVYELEAELARYKDNIVIEQKE